MIGDSVGGMIDSAIAVPRDIVTGDFGKLPGDIFNNAVTGVSNVLLPGTGSFLGDMAMNAAVGAGGSALGSALFGSGNTGSPEPSNPGPAAPAPFTPKRESAMQFPGNMAGIQGLASDQIGSNLATQGVYGGGLGEGESDYFLNMINRKLVDDTGQYDQNFGDVLPIEQSYLSQLGYGGKSKPYDLLEALSRRFA